MTGWPRWICFSGPAGNRPRGLLLSCLHRPELQISCPGQSVSRLQFCFCSAESVTHWAFMQTKVPGQSMSDLHAGPTEGTHCPSTQIRSPLHCLSNSQAQMVVGQQQIRIRAMRKYFNSRPSEPSERVNAYGCEMRHFMCSPALFWMTNRFCSVAKITRNERF